MRRMMLLCLPLVTLLVTACPAPDLTEIQWIQVNPEGGAEPAFQSGWANSGGGYEPLEFGKDHLGQVQISGAIVNAGSVSTTTLFTLPSGYRPAYTKFLPVVVATSGGTSGLGELWIFSNGNVQL